MGRKKSRIELAESSSEPQQSLGALAPPNAQRIHEVRSWLVNQAISDIQPVAALAITITADGMIRTDSCAIEPEHVEILVGELHEVAQRLLDAVAPRAGLATVHRLQRTA